MGSKMIDVTRGGNKDVDLGHDGIVTVSVIGKDSGLRTECREVQVATCSPSCSNGANEKICRGFMLSMFMLTKPSEPAKSISLSKVCGVSNKRTVVHHLHVDKSDDVELTR